MDYQKKYHKYKAKYLNLKHGGKTDKCVKSTLKKYIKRPSPPYPANECKNLKKKGNDGKVWISKPNKKGVYRWTKVNGCIKSTLKKYTKRPSPPYPANECKNLKKKGNDGNIWISKLNKRGVYRWVKFNKPKPLKFKPKYKVIHNKKDLQAHFMKYKDKQGKIHIDYDAIDGAIKFARYVQLAFEELFDNGIIAFIYPTGHFLAGDAWNYTKKKIRQSKVIKKMMKNRKTPFLFYISPSVISNEIWLKHSLITKEQGKIVYKILKKHFGKKYKWNITPDRAMKLKLKEKAKPIEYPKRKYRKKL